ncbi:MAG: beta-galactosidase, partial [Candidatus Latescibacterota bacterium]
MTPEMYDLIRGRAIAPEGAPVFLFGGELHYFRIPRPLWRDRLRKARAAFLNMTGAYIPWNFHEPEEGRFDFGGDRDLREWLECIRESGMYLFARPGPYICSEWDGGGLPAWFLGKDRLARTDDPEYLEAVSRWFREVNGVIRDFLPEAGKDERAVLKPPTKNRGNLVLYQIENELIWNEPQYFRQMLAWVRRDGITCPLLTNLAPDVRKSPDIIDSLDLYPGPWNIHKPEVAIANLLEEQPAKPPACVELQMGFAVEVGSTLPTMVGAIDKEWVELHTKNNIARGLNILNYYMFAGGTSFGYNTGRRDITSYDYDSAIRE